MLMMLGFSASLSNARKVLRFGRSLDEVEKIKYISTQMGGNWLLRAATAVAHGFSFWYYLLDNYIYIMKVQLSSIHKMAQGTKYDPDVESVLALNASTRMAGLHHYTKDFMARLGAWIQLRNMCSFARLVIAIAVELCRLYELGIEVQRAEARMAVNPELYNESVEQLRAKRFTSILKLVQDGASFMKLCSAFSGLRLFLLPKVSEKEAAFFGVVNCLLGIHRNWPASKVVEQQGSYFNPRKGLRGEPTEPTTQEAASPQVFYPNENEIQPK
eukprot:TRINITY_DN8737_c0_g1_i2.p1 TRINITY_DN8737_c0_g1~~TRINITY_DN8737_c0_g1_i2.p1  ORF type:complete len:272 (+),score=77.90 TRINITY_DN8737_c0_g1_i2:135-950(+)